jgi:hypothetical protein
MSKVIIALPDFEARKDLFAYLRKEVSKIIAQKKALPTVSDNLEFGYSIKEPSKSFTGTKTKDAAPDTESNPGELAVDIIANVSGWCDSQMDVMIKDNWKKSINDVGASGQKLVYHLKDHGTFYQYTLDSIIGKDCSLYTKDIDLSMFNFNSDVKKAQALLMTSTVCADYDQKAYNLYEDGEVKQHSIGLQYVKIYLCMNSEEAEDSQYKDNWDKYYSQVINKDKVDSKGYFWAVTESKILEVSAVLFGSNELTPTLNVSGKDTFTQPSRGTEEKPLEVPKAFDLDHAIESTIFFN